MIISNKFLGTLARSYSNVSRFHAHAICVCIPEIFDCLRGVVSGVDEERRDLTVLVVDSFVLTLLDATVGLAAVIDAGFLGAALSVCGPRLPPSASYRGFC